jgi:hypothetical protein
MPVTLSVQAESQRFHEWLSLPTVTAEDLHVKTVATPELARTRLANQRIEPIGT